MTVTDAFLDALIEAPTEEVDELMALCLCVLLDRSGPIETRHLNAAVDEVGYARTRRADSNRGPA